MNESDDKLYDNGSQVSRDRLLNALLSRILEVENVVVEVNRKINLGLSLLFASVFIPVVLILSGWG